MILPLKTHPSDPTNNVVYSKNILILLSMFPFGLSVLYQGELWESLALTSLTQPIPGRAVIADFIRLFSPPPFSWRPVEERMGNSDVINLGTAGQRSMQTLRVPRLVPMCLCPVDGEIDGVVLPACAAPASQHAD